MNLNEPIHTIREVTAKSAALESYAKIHDRFSEQEQMLALIGEVVTSEGAHVYALIALRAYRAELDDPEPKA